MNESEFVNEVEVLADKLASLLEGYAKDHNEYAGRTEDGKPIILAMISVSMQDGELATVSADIGTADSECGIEIKRFPNTNSDRWSVAYK